MPWYFYSQGAFVDEPKPPAIPPGAVLPFVSDDAGSPVVPTGWLLCDGSSYAIATYPDLYAAVLTFFNVPAPAGGQFRVPNLNGRLSRGGSASVPVSESFAGGTDTHAHANVVHGHTMSTLHLHTTPAHTHNFLGHRHLAAQHHHPPGTLNIPSGVTGENAKDTPNDVSAATPGHTHAVTGLTDDASTRFEDSPTFVVNSDGGGISSATGGPPASYDASVSVDPANHLPPYLNVFFIIKT